jgi:hypothetical protein
VSYHQPPPPQPYAQPYGQPNPYGGAPQPTVWGAPKPPQPKRKGVQAEGKGFQPLDMMQTGFAATSKKIREEVRKSR